ncbi:MAG: osmolarity sensor protein EnvZ [Rhizobium sp.]|nr:osmolarity sensor protein EnvZ [Rhizobium sp.]
MSSFLPRSLPAWVLFILVVVVISFQAVTLLVADYSVADNLRTADLFRLAERIAGVARALSGQTHEKRLELVSGLQSAFLAVTIDKVPTVSSIIAGDDEMAELEDILTAKLATDGVTDLRIAEYDANSGTSAQGLTLHRDGSNDGIAADLAREAQNFGTSGYFAASMKTEDSGWINFVVKKSPDTMPLTGSNLAIYVLLAAVPLVICVWAVYQLVWPYRRLERAVRRLGENLRRPEIPERGGYEVRAVIRAINTMQKRLNDHMAEREHLAAALAHDLRTPLTRMKIRCELSRSPTVQLLGQDIREIERIVNSVLEFSRAGVASGPKEKIELTSLVQDVCDQFADGVHFDPGHAAGRSVVVMANATFLSRAITNLVENAVRHGGSAQVSVVATAPEWVSVVVEDNGRGIPEDQLANVVKPFYRIETSRNRDTGGTGLGLAISDSVALSHGGRLELANRQQGGLAASLVLPLLPQG